MTEESIETEAVYHYAPGAAILSMGNIGCMMHCEYCHNWRTSQARYVTDDVVHVYTPEEVVEEALARGIKVLSWTYNDPVVWHEFVLDTARLGKEHGLINLYKSAFFISMEGASELVDVIDIFSVSVKSMDPKFYKKVTKGWLEPVLEATEYVYAKGRHVEISNLVVTDANDAPEETIKIAEWVLGSLGSEVPLHYVRFHPDYKYTHVGRTPIDRLESARKAALDLGIQYCYLGNVYDSDATNSRCPNCGDIVVRRYGLNAEAVGLSADSTCRGCGARLPFKLIAADQTEPETSSVASPTTDASMRHDHKWRGDVKAVHLEFKNQAPDAATAYVAVLGGEHDGQTLREVPVMGHRSFRVICCKSWPDDIGISVSHPEHVQVDYFDVYDRAHFPTASVDVAEPVRDATPGPIFRRASQVVADANS